MANMAVIITDEVAEQIRWYCYKERKSKKECVDLALRFFFKHHLPAQLPTEAKPCPKN